MRIILFLVLVNLEYMVSSMRRNQAPDGVFLQMGIDFAEKYAELLAIRLQSG